MRSLDSGPVGGLARLAATAAVYFLLALGLAYNAAKFHLPWFGGGDFIRYAAMTEHPFANAIGAPFAYRIVTPTLAHLLLEGGIHYRGDVAFAGANLTFSGIAYRPETLQALIFANTLFIVAALTSLNAALLTAARDVTDRILALLLPLVLLLAFSTVVHGFAGLTEGGSLFFVAVLALLRLRGQFVTFAVVAFLAIAQREIIPLVIAIWLLARDRRLLPDRWAGVCFAAFAAYFAVRWWFPLPGYEYQTSVAGMLANVAGFRPDADYLLQGLLANTVPLAILAMAIAVPGLRLKPLVAPGAVLAALLALGVAMALQNNTGRIANLATPLFVIALGEMAMLARRRDQVGCDDAAGQSAKAASST